MGDAQTDTVITHPDVRFYDFYEAWTSPNVTDASKYLSTHSSCHPIPLRLELGD